MSSPVSSWGIVLMSGAFQELEISEVLTVVNLADREGPKISNNVNAKINVNTKPVIRTDARMIGMNSWSFEEIFPTMTSMYLRKQEIPLRYRSYSYTKER